MSFITHRVERLRVAPDVVDRLLDVALERAPGLSVILAGGDLSGMGPNKKRAVLCSMDAAQALFGEYLLSPGEAQIVGAEQPSSIATEPDACVSVACHAIPAFRLI